MSDTDTKKAVVPPPPRARRGILAAVPDVQVEPAPTNMQKPNSGVQDMNFKVSPSFHHEFKMAAVYKGMAMKDLLEAAFRCWVEHYGDDLPKLPPHA